MKNLLKFGSLAKVLLVSAIFFNGNIRDYMLIGLTSAWLIGNLFVYIRSRGKAFIPLARNCIENFRSKPEIEQVELAENKKEEKIEDNEDTQDAIQVEPVVQYDIPFAAQEFLMRNVNCRITEKLKRSFPGASWSWESEIPISQVGELKSVRIRTFNTKTYNCANVIFRPNGSIDFEMLHVLEIKDTEGTDADEKIHEIDVKSWYEMAMSNSIRDITNELFSKGHRKMFINEAGDVYFNEGQEDISCGKIEHFIGKNLWSELIKCFREDDITAKIDGDKLALSW